MTDKNKNFELSDELLKSALYDNMLIEMEKAEESLKEPDESEHEFSESFKADIRALIDKACDDLDKNTEDCTKESQKGDLENAGLNYREGSKDSPAAVIRFPRIRRKSLAAVASFVLVAGMAFLTLRINYPSESYESGTSAAAFSLNMEDTEKSAESLQSDTAAAEAIQPEAAAETFAASNDEAAGAAMPKSAGPALEDKADTEMPAPSAALRKTEAEERPEADVNIAGASAGISASSANPIRDVGSKEDFVSALGIRLSEPYPVSGNVNYSVISDSIAQISYYSDNLETEVTLRGSSAGSGMSPEELSGIYYEYDENSKRIYDETVQVNDSGRLVETSITIEYALSGDGTKEGALVSWSADNCDYSLWAPSTDKGYEELLVEAENVIAASFS